MEAARLDMVMRCYPGTTAAKPEGQSNIGILRVTEVPPFSVRRQNAEASVPIYMVNSHENGSQGGERAKSQYWRYCLDFLIAYTYHTREYIDEIGNTNCNKYSI